MTAGFTGLWFNYKATIFWFFGWTVSVYQTGAYDYHNGTEWVCGTKDKLLYSYTFPSKFQAMMFRERVNRQQFHINHSNGNINKRKTK